MSSDASPMRKRTKEPLFFRRINNGNNKNYRRNIIWRNSDIRILIRTSGKVKWI